MIKLNNIWQSTRECSREVKWLATCFKERGFSHLWLKTHPTHTHSVEYFYLSSPLNWCLIQVHSTSWKVTGYPLIEIFAPKWFFFLWHESIWRVMEYISYFSFLSRFSFEPWYMTLFPLLFSDHLNYLWKAKVFLSPVLNTTHSDFPHKIELWQIANCVTSSLFRKLVRYPKTIPVSENIPKTMVLRTSTLTSPLILH